MTQPADDPLDELFAASLADFIKTRDRLAAEVRKRGDKDRAAEVKALAKPTPAAWAVNQASRANPRAMQRLLEASDRMARLQLRAGDPESRRRFEEASAEHRQTLGELVEGAAGALREAGHAAAPPVLERVANNLRWGALDEDARPLLTRARLQRDLAPAGFGAFASPEPAEEEATIDLARPRSAAGPTVVPPRLVPHPSADLGALRVRLREAEKRTQQAEAELERRAAAAQSAQEELAEHERQTQAAQETLRAAQKARAEAEAHLAREDTYRKSAAAALALAEEPASGDEPSGSGKRRR